MVMIIKLFTQSTFTELPDYAVLGKKAICLILELVGTAHTKTKRFTPESSIPHP